MDPSQPLPIPLNPPMRTHLRSLLRRPLPSPTCELFASYSENLTPPSECDTGILLGSHPSHIPAVRGGVEGTAEDFVEFMRGKDGNGEAPLGPEEREMGYPLSSYFVNSSHNTYLTGNQLYGQSSESGYKDVLLRGCRCIEIDVWDGEPKSHPSTPSDTPSNTLAPSETHHRFRPHIPRSLAPHSHGLSIRSKSPSSSSDKTPDGDTLALPTPWQSFSTTTRAEPRVLHGYTLTKEVSFREVCAAIRDSAFVSSDLPVIVSLEVHCSSEQQEIMVEIIEKSWKGMLVPIPSEPCRSLPSPEELRGKILVKVKYANPEAAKRNAVKASTPKLQRERSTSSGSPDSENQNAVIGDEKKKKKTSIIESLSALGVYTRSYHFKSLTTPEALEPTHVFSLSEKKLMEVHESHGPTLFSHNRNFLMRAFPSGMRVSSSNLDPSVFWRKGVQMVALNWQKYDEGMMLNQGMFAGSRGWVLKPNGYRGTTTARMRGLSHESQADAITHRTLSLTVEIIAGQDIPLPIGDKRPSGFHPYVKCELHVEKPEERSGAPIKKEGKSKEGEYKMVTKTSKGVEPVFGGERMEFRQIPGVVNELSFLRFKIQDDEIGKDDLAAWACIRLDRLQAGYRFVRLLDAVGAPSQGVLLVKIEKSST